MNRVKKAAIMYELGEGYEKTIQHAKKRKRPAHSNRSLYKPPKISAAGSVPRAPFTW